jgi:hypothetical protein
MLFPCLKCEMDCLWLFGMILENTKFAQMLSFPVILGLHGHPITVYPKQFFYKYENNDHNSCKK